jgi:hypothetical protein
MHIAFLARLFLFSSLAAAEAAPAKRVALIIGQG